MNKLFCATLAFAATLATPALHAADTFYLGAGIGTRGTLHVNGPEGKQDNINHPRPFKVFGGYELTDNFAIEAGYTDFGKYKFAMPGTVDIKTFHLVAKGSIKLGESWALFGKAGASHAKIEHPGFGLGDLSDTRPMLAIGAEYAITNKLALGLELVNQGTVKSDNAKLNLRQAQVSVRYSF